MINVNTDFKSWKSKKFPTNFIMRLQVKQKGLIYSNL